MYRGSSDFTDMIEGIDPLMSTYNSSSPLRASASSSKAVLAALRALQDKIRRLESERTQALDETAKLRLQIKNSEIESDHMKQRDNLASLKNLQEVRTAYDRILTEKTEAEIRLSKLEDRNRVEEEIARGLRVKIRDIEDDKHRGLTVIRDLEGERAHLQGEILHIQQKEKDLGATIIWETQKHEEDMDVLSSKLHTLQSDLTTLIHEKSVVETKLLELDQLVGQLLLVNESLVVRLSGRPIPKAVTGGGRGTGGGGGGVMRRKKITPTPLPRAAYTSTVMHEASTNPLSMRDAAEDASNLHNLHRMYVDLARNITEKHVSSNGHSNNHSNNYYNRSSGSVGLRGSGRKNKEGREGSVGRERSMSREGREGTDGREGREGGYAEHTPQPSPSVSFDQNGNNYSSGNNGNGYNGNHNGNSHNVSNNNNYNSSNYGINDSSNNNNDNNNNNNNSSNSNYKYDMVDLEDSFNGNSFNGNYSASFIAGGNTPNRGNNGTNNGTPNRGNNGTNNEMFQGGEQVGGQGGLQSVISSLEEEFTVLNGQYRSLLSNIRTHSPAKEILQEEELVSIIQKLHRKGEQLRSLKSPST